MPMAASRASLPDWEEHLRHHPLDATAAGWRCDRRRDLRRVAEHPEDIYCAMVLALRDYVDRNRFPGVVLGLSGGIDSAICAAIAADALGPDRVWCVMLPSRFHQPGKPRPCHPMRGNDRLPL
jgi:NAD+ synthase